MPRKIVEICGHCEALTGNPHDYLCKEANSPDPKKREKNILIRPSWNQVFMQFALDLSQRSSCRRASVGCIVTSSDNNRVLAIGYNGNVRGGNNDCDSFDVGKCGCVHAEANCIVKLDYNDASEKTMHTTCQPCLACSKLIVNANVKRVVFKDVYRDDSGMDVLSLGGVDVFKYHEHVSGVLRDPLPPI